MKALFRAAAVLVVAPALVGCAPKPPATATVLVLADVSGSVRRPEMQQAYCAAFDKVFDALEPGDALIAAPITSASELTFDLPVQREMPDPGLERADNRLIRSAKMKNARERIESLEPEVREQFKTWLEADHGKVMWTDLFGALRLAQQLFANYPERPIRRLVILSDMIQDSPDWQFDELKLTDDRRTTIIRRLEQAGAMPRLDGVRVHVAGAYADDQARLRRIRGFWQEYFAAAGASLRPADYGTTLIRFEIDRKADTR